MGAEAVPVEQDPEHDRDPDHPEELRRDAVPPAGDQALDEAVRELGACPLASCPPDHDPAPEEPGADRGDERGNAEADDDEPVQEADTEAGGELRR